MIALVSAVEKSRLLIGFTVVVLISPLILPISWALELGASGAAWMLISFVVVSESPPCSLFWACKSNLVACFCVTESRMFKYIWVFRKLASWVLEVPGNLVTR